MATHYEMEKTSDIMKQFRAGAPPQEREEILAKASEDPLFQSADAKQMLEHLRGIHLDRHDNRLKH